jgi:hypothetical protein
MAQHQGTRPEREATGWVGWVFFAGVLMLMVGSFNVLAGIVALFNDEYYLVGESGLLVEADFTTWGWGLML